MLRRAFRVCCTCLLAISIFLPMTAIASSITLKTGSAQQTTALADFPTVDPNYIYTQLFTLVTRFQAREAGYDPTSGSNGHIGFANYWSQEAVKDLQGFGPVVRRDPFAIQGWDGRPATTPAVNVEVSVPGAIHPEQVVVIGCHYDGMAFSTQSANDDGSGCAIELGVAKALGDYWRSHHSYPARTLRFVIFDAEEQGVFGSFHYVNETVNGDLSNIVAMFNEEQNGIAYPLRYLGQMQNPLMPFYIEMSPLNNNNLYRNQSGLTQLQRDNITRFRSLAQQAIPAIFQQFQALGYVGLTYHGAAQPDIPQPIFTPNQINNVQLQDDLLGGSDQIPFTLVGLPCATMVGNSSYYDDPPPPDSYPFDQREDTIQLMNTFADGSSQKSNALVLALALPGMFTTWMLHQPDILGEAQASTLPAGPLAAISDVGQTKVGQSLALNAHGSFDTQQSALTYSWDFGDGSKGTGIEVNHTYTAAGTYTLTLSAISATGTRKVSKTLQVVNNPVNADNPYQSHGVGNGRPRASSQVILPLANDTLSDKVLSSAAALIVAPQIADPQQATNSNGGNTTLIALLVGALILGVLLVGGLRLRARLQRK